MPVLYGVGLRAAACLLLPLGLLASGCGDETSSSADPGTPSATADALAGGDWLLRFNTAEGADGERSRSVYVRFDPTKGVAVARRMPGVTAGDSYADEQALLISADHAWSLLDTAVPAADGRAGRITLYAVDGPATKAVPVRTWAGADDLVPVAAAFDPEKAGVLRVVDSAHRVWLVDTAAGTATDAGQLPRREAWIYGNGFDKNTGEPYIESIDSDATEPAGNGDSDVRPVERQGGKVLYYDGTPLPGLPESPCGFAGGFTTAEGDSWLFCADTPSIQAYRVEKGATAWQKFGMPSKDVVPGVASELAVVLPPVA